MKSSHILGLNARTQLYSYPFNNTLGRKIATSKLMTKTRLRKAGIPVPKMYAKFTTPESALSFDWNKLPDAFALKPSKGLGGEGIIVVKKRVKRDKKAIELPKKTFFSLFKSKFSQLTSQGIQPSWLTTQKKKVTADDLKLHVLDILEGAYSIGNIPDVAFIEEYVGRHKAFRKYAFRGTPDIRVIVFNKVPVMAMLRLPTKESGGRANLHQGAIAVGIDMATGITTRGYWHGEYIHLKPGSKRKLHGIKIPHWTKILETAVEVGKPAHLSYYGADVILHPEKGPMILELNYQPGLSIQMANLAGLKKRLERVEDLEVLNAEHGVKVAKALFVSNFSDRVKAEEGIKTLSAIEEITLKGDNGVKRKRVMAKIDTGAWRTSINSDLAKNLGLLSGNNILWSKRIRNSMGVEERPVVALTLWLAGRKIKTVASVAKRLSLKFPVIIGRHDLKGFVINPELLPSEKIEMVKKAKNN